MAHTHPQCVRCQLRLYRRNDPVFRGTVLAKGTHRCAEAAKVLTQATGGAALFAENREFVHVRYISPILTPRAWIETLQEWTAQELAHQILPLPGGASFVVSHRQDYEPDMAVVYAQIYAQIEAAGDRPAERIIGSWTGGRGKVLFTTSKDRSMP